MYEGRTASNARESTPPCWARVSLTLGALIQLSCGVGPDNELARALPTHPGINVLVVSFDALRVDELGLYGQELDTSPNLDRFAEEALVFEHAYSAAPVTPTSFAAAFTGQLPFRVFHAWRVPETETMAKAFSRAGYETFGIFHNTQLTPRRNFDQGFDHFDVFWGQDEMTLEKATAVLEAHKDERFFGWIHFLNPHSPYKAREMSRHFYDPHYRGRFQKSSGMGFTAENEAEVARLLELYRGEVFYVDVLFGELMSIVESAGLLENTIVVVTSDHGEEFGDHGGLQHDSQFEELIHIPLLIRHPDRLEGARTWAPYSNIDLFPTLSAIAAVEHDELADGLDLTQGYDPKRVRISVGMTNRRNHQISATRGPHKLIASCMPHYSEALYDLDDDPKEQIDLIGESPQVATGLRTAIQAAIGDDDPCRALHDSVRGVLPQEGLTPEEIEQLESLGYLD